MNKDLKYRASKDLDFLNCHPAYINMLSDSFLGSQCVCMYPVCKNGIDENSKKCLIIRRNEKGWEKFEKRFEDDDTYIYATYVEKYGYPWVYDHVEYFYEADFFAFRGNLNNTKDVLDFGKFSRYHGFTGTASSFEEAIIKCKRDTVKAFGDFNRDDFLTKKEKTNHKNEPPFFNKSIKNGKNKGLLRLTHNHNYICLSDAILNIRWLKWFVKTDYCKKNWGNNFDWCLNP